MSLLLFWNTPGDEPQYVDVQGVTMTFTIPIPALTQLLGLTLHTYVGSPALRQISTSDPSQLPIPPYDKLKTKKKKRPPRQILEVTPNAGTHFSLGAPSVVLDDSLERDLEEFLTLNL